MPFTREISYQLKHGGKTYIIKSSNFLDRDPPKTVYPTRTFNPQIHPPPAMIPPDAMENVCACIHTCVRKYTSPPTPGGALLPQGEAPFIT